MAPFYYLPHVLFVAERGLDHFDLSMRAQAELTKRFTAESSVRPYIAKDPERAFEFLRGWADDPDPHVRRLVSEGTRLRLPWASRVAWLDANPERVVTLLAVSVSHLDRQAELQLELPLGLPDEKRRPGTRQGAARWSADRAMDAIRARFGREAIGYAAVALDRRRSVSDAFRELAEKDLGREE